MRDRRAGPLRVAVIGAGLMGARHVACISATPGVVLSAVVDHHQDRAADLAADSGALVGTTVDEIVGRADLAIVAVPPASHADVAIRATLAGCHLLVEKPLAPTPAEARAILGAAARHGLMLAVGHVERFNPATVALLDNVHGPASVIAERSGPGPTGSPVDMVLDLMIHDLDLIGSLAGPTAQLAQVWGWTDRRVTVAGIRLSDGTEASLRTRIGSSTRSRWLQVSGGEGHLVADLIGHSVHRVDLDLSTVGLLPVTATDALRGQLSDVVGAIRDGRAPSVTGADGVRAVVWATAVIAALEERPAGLSGAPTTCDWSVPRTSAPAQ